MSDTLSMIIEKERELKPLYDRMDSDRLAVHLNQYILTGPKFPKGVPATISVTMNDLAVYANAVVSVLQSAGPRRQVSVTGVSDTAAKIIENFLEDCFYTIDVGLRPRRIASLWAWLTFHICHRGPTGVRLTWSKDGRPQALPLDMRFVPWEDSHENMEWIAIHTQRDASKINSLYNLTFNAGDNLEVYDFWTPTVNEVWISNRNKTGSTIRVEREERNPYGFIPFVLQFPGAGTMFLDEDSLSHSAESIFFLSRGLVEEWNRLASIQQTKAYELVRPPLKHPVPDKNMDATPQPYGYEMGKNQPYREGEEPEVMATPDVNNAFMGAEAKIGTGLHKGMPSISDLTDVKGERNAQWITEQTELRDKIIFPRLEGLQNLYQDAAVMLINGYKKLHGTFKDTVKLGRNEAKREYTPADLGDPTAYTIEYKYMPDNKGQKLANFSVGIAMKGELPMDMRYRDIYQLDDPEGAMDKMAVEQAEQSDPIIFYRNLGKRLIRQAKKHTGEEKKELCIEASIMADNMVDAIKKRTMASMGNQGSQPQGTQGLQIPESKQQSMLALPAIMGGRNGGQQGVKNAA